MLRPNLSSASFIEISSESKRSKVSKSKVPATALLPKYVDLNRVPSSSANPITSTAKGRRFPWRSNEATQ